jgi:predicted enzyme related to lactoylglutathione lyase
MHVEGITWHTVVLEPEAFAATKRLMTETFGLSPALDRPGFVVFIMKNGTLLQLCAPEHAPAYGFNGAIAFGFRIDDIEAASRDIEAAGCEMLGEIKRLQDIGYAYRHFRGPDGRVYNLNELRVTADQPS